MGSTTIVKGFDDRNKPFPSSSTLRDLDLSLQTQVSDRPKPVRGSCKRSVRRLCWDVTTGHNIDIDVTPMNLTLHNFRGVQENVHTSKAVITRTAI